MQTWIDSRQPRPNTHVDTLADRLAREQRLVDLLAALACVLIGVVLVWIVCAIARG